MDVVGSYGGACVCAGVGEGAGSLNQSYSYRFKCLIFNIHLCHTKWWPRVMSFSKSKLSMMLHGAWHTSCCSKWKSILKEHMLHQYVFTKSQVQTEDHCRSDVWADVLDQGLYGLTQHSRSSSTSNVWPCFHNFNLYLPKCHNFITLQVSCYYSMSQCVILISTNITDALL